jgi:hypothetical protein
LYRQTWGGKTGNRTIERIHREEETESNGKPARSVVYDTRMEFLRTTTDCTGEPGVKKPKTGPSERLHREETESNVKAAFSAVYDTRMEFLRTTGRNFGE